MIGPSDILTTVQNGVVALNNATTQLKGSFNNIAGQLTAGSSNTSANTAAIVVNTAAIAALNAATYVNSIAGNHGAFTLSSATGISNSVNVLQVAQATASQFGTVRVDNTTITATAGVISAATIAASPITNSLSSDVALNVLSSYFDGPSVAQGTVGTWFASGTVTLLDTGGSAQFDCRLWDGTTVMASAATNATGAGLAITVSLSGFLTSPASNIKISCRGATRTTGLIKAAASGNTNDSTITAYRIA